MTETTHATDTATTEAAMVRIPTRYRSLNSKGNGTETMRMVLTMDPHDGEGEGTGRAEWAGEAAERIEGQWLPVGRLAANRKCSESGELPTDSLILDMEWRVKGYQRQGRATYRIGRVGADGIAWDAGEHIKTRKDGGYWVHVIEVDCRRYVIR